MGGGHYNGNSRLHDDEEVAESQLSPSRIDTLAPPFTAVLAKTGLTPKDATPPFTHELTFPAHLPQPTTIPPITHVEPTHAHSQTPFNNIVPSLTPLPQWKPTHAYASLTNTSHPITQELNFPSHTHLSEPTTLSQPKHGAHAKAYFHNPIPPTNQDFNYSSDLPQPSITHALASLTIPVPPIKHCLNYPPPLLTTSCSTLNFATSTKVKGIIFPSHSLQPTTPSPLSNIVPPSTANGKIIPLHEPLPFEEPLSAPTLASNFQSESTDKVKKRKGNQTSNDGENFNEFSSHADYAPKSHKKKKETDRSES